MLRPAAHPLDVGQGKGGRVVELEYDLVPRDLVALNLHFSRTSEDSLRQKRLFRWGLSVASSLVAGALFGLALHDTGAGAMAFAVTAVAVWVLAPAVWIRSLARGFAGMAERGTLGATGPHRLRLEGEGLREHQPSGEVFASWPTISGVGETADHVFVFYAPLQAFVVPKRAGARAVAEFVSEVRARSGNLGDVPAQPAD